ncbi:hypothetical protein ACJW31_03G187300 [Castanea mollissima]
MDMISILPDLFLTVWTWRRKPSGGGGSGFSAIPKIASVGCGFSAISKVLLSLIPSGGGRGSGEGGGCGGGCGGGGGISAIPKVFIFFIAIFMLWIVIPSSSNIRNGFSILHQVPEGHVGVYWRGGALLKTVNDPGFHLKLPFITRYEPVQVTLQTDQVRDIPCGTKGGVMINFEKIEVVNRLHKDYVHDTLLKYGEQYDKIWIYDKIHHEINQFCNSHSLLQVYIDVFDQIGEKMKDALQGDCRRNAPGIEIISVHVTKPTIPESIRRNFEQLKEERIKVLIAIEKQRVVEIEAETNKKKAISEAENSANVGKILMKQKLMEKDSARKQQEIENQIYMDRQKVKANANLYRELKEAEANKLKLTPQYLELKLIEAIKNILSEENAAIKKNLFEENVFVYSIVFMYMCVLMYVCARRLLVYFL